MNNLLYARLAKTNLSKNRQNILPYLLSCIGSVVMFFIMDTLAQGSGFDSMIGKDTILAVMGMVPLSKEPGESTTRTVTN